MANNPVNAGSSDPHNAAVTGTNSNGGWGVTGRSATGVGVSGESQSLIGVSGVTHDANNAGVLGTNTGGGWGVTGRSDGAEERELASCRGKRQWHRRSWQRWPACSAVRRFGQRQRRHVCRRRRDDFKEW